MQKNSLTNKITPCCGLPFSVVYWWVSNLTLNSEADREFIVSKISQNGTITIDGWKVLANSATLESDASFTKEMLLSWFDCGRQPSCEQLKMIIEGFKVGNWDDFKNSIEELNEAWLQLENKLKLKYNNDSETEAVDIIQRVDQLTGVDVNYREVTTWYDGSAMTDLKTDGTVFIKKGTKYYKLQQAEIDVKMFGAVADGDEISFSGTNNKTALEKAFRVCSQNKLKLIIDGKFKTMPLIMNFDNVNILMKTGSYLFGDDTYIWSDRLWNISGKNINIEAYGAFVKLPNTFTTGEDRHCLNITSVEDLTIKGLKTIGGGGDGFYIGNIGTPPKKVKLIDVSAYNARRNGISLINGIDIHIVRPICELANGTYPMAGIDIECNGSTIQEELRGIRIEDAITRNNNGYGILISPQFLIGGTVANPTYTDKTIDIVISGHLSEKDGWDGMRGGFGLIGIHDKNWGAKMNGKIKYQGIAKNSGSVGFRFEGWDYLNAPFCDVDIYIENPCSNLAEGAINNYKNAVYFGVGAGSLYDIGNLDLKVKILDDRITPVMFTPIYFYNNTKGIKKTNIVADVNAKSLYSVKNYYGINLGVFEGNISFPNGHFVENAETLTSDIKHLLGTTLLNTGAITTTLPLASSYIGNTISFKNVGANYQNIRLTSGDKFLDNSSNPLNDIIVNLGQLITLKAEPDGWRVTYSSDRIIRKAFTGGDQPKAMQYGTTAPTSGIWKKGDIVWNTLTSGNVGWVCTVAGDFAGTAPTFVVFGMIGASKAVTQADSAATDIAGLKTDFNALLAKLKSAGLMS